MRSNRSRAAVMKHCPRILRIGLNPVVTFSLEPAALAQEIVQHRPAKKRQVDAWLRMAMAKTSRERPWPDALNTHRQTRRLVEDLDTLAREDPVLGELADCLLLMTTAATDLGPASRLAHRLWQSLGQLGKFRNHLNSEASLPLSEKIVDELSYEVDCDGPSVDGLIDRVRKIVVEIEGEATELAMGMSMVAAGNVEPNHTCRSLAELARQCGAIAAAPIAWALQENVGLPRSTSKPAAPDLDRTNGDQRSQHPSDQVMVCPAVLKSKGSKDAIQPFENAIGVQFPLVRVPDLASVRQWLTVKFPYAENSITRVLTDLTTKQFVHFTPTLLVGPPGSGKSTFVRILSEQLKVGLMRVDGSNDVSSSFSGTERRWNSSEPCRPFLAVARFRQANPMMLIDEVDKAGSRQEYGRLWDAMLQFMESETASRFHDPCLQSELDLRHVSIIATANETDRLPGPLLDRFRVIEFPKPEARHLEVLIPDIIQTIAADQGLHPRFFNPLDQIELSVLARRWRGGSIRPLKRAIESILRARDRRLATYLQ